MTACIAHRGPDDEGYLLFPARQSSPFTVGGPGTPGQVFNSSWTYAPKLTVNEAEHTALVGALGHRRLSIVDLSPAGHQPMCTQDQNLWITYNGEIYNHLELRKELESCGYRFYTHSDTEVLLNAYACWGKGAFDRFNGFFTFILCDLKEGLALAVRDRFGIKPLYYWESPEGLVAFASEIKQFAVLPGWSASLNGQRAYDYLNWGLLDTSEETLFKGVRQLRGGEYMEFSIPFMGSEPLSPKRWYQLHRKPFQGSFQEACRTFQDLLQDSIRLRLRADVDVGTCLSGGLDSSSIVCIVNRLLGKQGSQGKQKTFSACAQMALHDEKKYIDLVTAQTNVASHCVYPSLEDLFNELDDLVWHQDEPFNSTSLLAQWMVFKQVHASNVKVMLNGQGADEQLAGYHGFFGNLFYDLFRSMRWHSLMQEIRGSRKVDSPTMRPIPQLIGKLVPHGIRQPLRRMLGRTSTNQSWLDVSRLGAVDRDPFFQDHTRDLHHQSRVQILHTSLPVLLHYEDRNSMAHSVESRTPFMDYRLVEFSLGLPAEYKISDGWTKRVLRESMKGIIPEEIRLRTDKMAFGTGEEDWIQKQNPKRFLLALDESIETSGGVLTPAIRLYAQRLIENKVPFSHQLWRAICFGHWVRKFNVTI